MGTSFSQDSIVRAIADEAARGVARRVIFALQRMTDTMLSGSGSRLANAWDEICAQIQYEESFFWEAYDDTVRSLASGFVTDLPGHVREAVWLQTQAGIEWDFEESEESSAYPVAEDDIVDYVVREYVYVQAANWTNARIRAYIDRS